MASSSTDLLKKAVDYHDESLSAFPNFSQETYTWIRKVICIYFVQYI